MFTPSVEQIVLIASGVGWAVVWILFLDTVRAQYKYDVEESSGRMHTMIVLALRSALIVPLLATTFLYVAYFPGAAEWIALVNSVIESYSLRCFYVLILTYFGGRRSMTAAIEDFYENRGPRCFDCLQRIHFCFATEKDAASSVVVAESFLLMFIYGKPAVEVAAVMLRDVSTAGYFACSVSAYLIALSCLFALLYLVISLHREGGAMQLDRKFLFVKCVVFVILAENFVRTLVCFVNHDTWTLNSQAETSICRSASLWFAEAVVLQLALLSFLYLISFKPRMAVAARARHNEYDDINVDFFLTDFLSVWATMVPFEPGGIIGRRFFSARTYAVDADDAKLTTPLLVDD